MKRILLIFYLIMAVALIGCESSGGNGGDGDGGGDGGGSGSSSTLVAPSAVIANAVSSVEVELSWTGSADSGAVSYTIYRDGETVGTTADLTFADVGLTAGTTYCYSVAANDADGNTSERSAESCVNTVAATTVNVTINSTGTGYAFTSSMDTFSVGYTYSFVITNNNSVLHEWMIMPRGSLDETQALVMADAIPPGATVTQEYTFTQVGEYEYACHITNHYALGLHLDIIVE